MAPAPKPKPAVPPAPEPPRPQPKTVLGRPTPAKPPAPPAVGHAGAPMPKGSPANPAAEGPPRKADPPRLGERELADAVPSPHAPEPVPRTPSRRQAQPTMLDAELAERPTTVVRLAPGRTVPGTRYQVRRLLGSGSAGTVFEVEHLDLGRRAAMKVLNEVDVPGSDRAETFRREARAASSIGSPYIVDAYDYGVLPDGRLMFVMESVKGLSMHELLAEPMSPARTIGILRQVCKGLHDAHATGLVHRDVKPGNILLYSKGGRSDRVKILDFGIAARAEDTAAGRLMTAGTPFYMAPEVFSPEGFDHRADIYALGCTAYEMLVGEPPFTGGRVDELIACHAGVDPEPLRERVDIPEALDKVILRCIAKSPADRYADMRDLEAALCEAQIEAGLTTPWDDLPVPEVESERRDRIMRAMPEPGLSLRRPRWKIFAAAALVVGLGLGVAGTRLLGGGESPAVLERVRAHELAAQAAAAKHYFVYPPAEKPGEMTAYDAVLALEADSSLEEDIAEPSALALRNGFADTLVRLGDYYWERTGGQPFARDYYQQAIVFAPELERAKKRAGASAGELADLRSKAETRGFSHEELVAVEPLRVLAEAEKEQDVQQRRRKMVTLLRKRAAQSSRAAASLEALAQESGVSKKEIDAIARDPELAANGAAAEPPTPDEGAEALSGTTRAEIVDAETGTEPETEPDAPAAPKPVAQPAPKPAPEIKPTAAKPPKPKSDPKLATALVAKGRAAQRAGQRSRAQSFFFQAIDADRRSHAAYLGLSELAFDAAQYSQAVRYGKHAVRLKPKHAKSHVQLGNAYFKTLRLKDARSHYDRAAKLGHGGAVRLRDMVDRKLGK